MTCSIIPSYLLQHILETAGDAPASGETVREPTHPCSRTLQLDEQLRAARRARRDLRGTAAATQGPAAKTDAKRSIYNANNTEDLPGTVARQDDDPRTGD